MKSMYLSVALVAAAAGALAKNVPEDTFGTLNPQTFGVSVRPRSHNASPDPRLRLSCERVAPEEGGAQPAVPHAGARERDAARRLDGCRPSPKPAPGGLPPDVHSPPMLDHSRGATHP